MQNKKQADLKLKEAYDTYFEKIARFCNVKLKNRTEAQDCVQDCFMVYYKLLLRGENVQNVGAFLYKTADNLVKVQFRQDKKANNTVSIDELSQTLAATEVIDCSHIDFEALAEKIISVLDEKEQCLYRQKYVDEMSITEIAQEWEISFDAAAKRLSRMRQKVKDLIAQEMKGGEYN